MSQRMHDPTETGLPEYSTTGTLRETLEKLKGGPDFHITVEIGGETDDAVRLMAEMLKGYDREVFCIVNFRNDMTPINMNIVSMGTLNASLVHPREILKSSILSNTAHVMALHNHPSGSLSPSQEDIQITDRLQKLLDLAGIPLLDHIVIGNGDRYYSFRENQTLPVSENRFATAPEQIHFSPVPEMMVAESTVPGKTADSNGKSESRADRVKVITDKLEAGIAALFQSETYKACLSTMGSWWSSDEAAEAASVHSLSRN